MTLQTQRTRRSMLVLLSVTLLAGVAACSRGVKPDQFEAAVPEAPRRMAYQVDSGPTPDIAPLLARALEQTICLLRSERADECQEPDPDVPVCNTRPVQEIQAALKPAFDAIPQMRLTSASSINAQLRASIPGGTSTTRVWDARRDHLCTEWRSTDGACVALKVDKAWILLHAPPGGDGRVDRFEVFLAERVCAAKPR